MEACPTICAARWIAKPHGVGGRAEVVADGAAVQGPGAAAFAVLEQVGHRRGVHELVLVAFDR